MNHVAEFHATAKSGSYKLQVSIKPFTGYHTYALHWQTADPGFVVNGPGGPFRMCTGRGGHRRIRGVPLRSTRTEPLWVWAF